MHVTGNQKFALALGIICLSLAPLIQWAAARITLVDQRGIIITQESVVSMEKAYNFNFTLTMGQSLVIKFGVNYENVTANLKILGKGHFEEELRKNATNGPRNVVGRYYLYSIPTWIIGVGANPIAGVTTKNVTCDRTESYSIEFMGDGDNANRIWTEPGEYVIVVYGIYALNVTGKEEVKFDLKATIDGPGPSIAAGLNLCGAFILVLCSISLFLNFKKKFVEAAE